MHLLLVSLSPAVIYISFVHIPLAKMNTCPLLHAGVLASRAPDWAASSWQQPNSGEEAGAGILGGPPAVFAIKESR